MRREPIYDRIDGLTSGIYFKVILFFLEKISNELNLISSD